MRNLGFIRGAGIKEIYGFLGVFRPTKGAKQKNPEKKEKSSLKLKVFPIRH